ncbi:hypothetical protein BURC_02133 [Burkholderiaceae bacterium]|nr:hypothetical protein BURC_02133 [Burkholderiaceae bacterium]
MGVTRTAATRVLQLLSCEQFDPRIEALRRTDYDPAAGSACLRDTFDDRSTHVLVSIDDALVGAVRVTQPPGVLRSWVGGARLPLPEGPRIAEFTRGVVSREWRGRGIYQLFMSAAVLRAGECADVGIATVQVDLHARRCLSVLGFQDRGEPIAFEHAPACSTLAQCIELDLRRARTAAAAQHQAARQRLLGHGLLVVDVDIEAETLSVRTQPPLMCTLEAYA